MDILSVFYVSEQPHTYSPNLDYNPQLFDAFRHSGDFSAYYYVENTWVPCNDMSKKSVRKKCYILNILKYVRWFNLL
jgi:hypothetical protein